MPLPLRRSPPQAPRKYAISLGFTLIELMFAIAIIGILAAIAIPNYQEYIRRSRISEAVGQLSTYRTALEQYYQDHMNYGSDASTCGDGIGIATGDSFRFTCTWGSSATSQSYVLTATGLAASGMNGYTFTVDQDNQRFTTAFPSASALPKSCWISRAGDSC